VVAFAPAGGWEEGDPSLIATLDLQQELLRTLATAAPHASAIAATAEGRRRATALLTDHGEDLPADLVAHMVLGAAACRGAEAMLALARTPGAYALDLARISCPVRIVWGTADRLLPWPAAAARFRRGLDAEWVELDGVGHAPQLDDPAATADLILGYSGR
jgi:pimeloyl-ACP methyl ester carboxylesterase